METVFDLATPEEIEILFKGYSQAGRERQRRHFLEDADSNFRQLASLYSIRGDMQTAESCIARIQDTARRLDAQVSIYGCEYGL